MKIEVSNGELVDKLTILEIKLNKITDKSKLINISKEYNLLKLAMNSAGLDSESEEYKQLMKVNLLLWNIEDKIRIKESKQEFDDEFISLARSVYFENDKRSEIKKRINLLSGSALIEEKQYVDYHQK